MENNEEYNKFINVINDQEKTEIRKDADKQSPSSVADLNTTTKANTDDKNSGFNQNDNVNEEVENMDVDIDENVGGLPSENDIQNEDRLSQVDVIESNQQAKINIKKNQENFDQNQVNHRREDIYHSSNNNSNGQKVQEMEIESDTESAKFNQDNPGNYQATPANGEITEKIPQNEDSKELKTTNESSNKSTDNPNMELLVKTNKKGEKYLIYDSLNLSTFIAVLNLIESINLRAKEKLDYKTDRIVLNVKFLRSKINDINDIYTYQDKTLFEFMVNFLNIPEKRIIALLKKEEEEKNKRIKLLHSLFSSKLTDITLMYLGFKTYFYVKYSDEILLMLRPYKTFKEQFGKYNIDKFLIFKKEIYKILNNGSLNIEKYIIPNIDGEGLISFNKELSKLNYIMEEELSNMLNSEKINTEFLFLEEERSIISYYIRREFFNCGKNSFNDYFIDLCKEYNSKSLHKLTIKPLLGQNFHEYRIFLNKKISQIYEDFIPRRHKKDSNYDYTTKQIKKAIEKETNDKIIYKIYENAYFFDFFYAFLEDKNFIIIEDEKNKTFEILKLKNFKTLKDYLVDGKFAGVEKEILKKDMREIFFEKKGRAKRNKIV